MDFLNEKDLFEKVVAPAIDKIDNETLPALERAVKRQVEAAAAQLAVVIAGALEGAQAVADKAVADLHREIAGLNGWTVEIGEIRIPPITIRLSGPQ